jgi:predicted dehydrogenase
LLDDGASVGRVRRISTAFSFRAPDAFFVDNIRANNRLEPHGCLGDLGWYCLRFALWVMKGQLPQCVTGRVLQSTGATRNTTGVPTEFSGELFFEGGVSSSFYCSFHTHNEQVARVSGTDGYVLVPDFVLPFYSHEVSFQLNQSAFTVSGCNFDMEPHWRTLSVPEHSHSHPNAQESNLFRTFADTARLRSGFEPWADLALKTQQMLEACFNSALNGSRLTDLV